MDGLDFYRGKRVLVTGHTGFKGAWLCRILVNAGAQVTGYALEPPTAPSLFELTRMEDRMRSVTGDIRDLEHLKRVFEETEPELVFHLAAQPLVRESYREPVLTYETNVMGTVNICECIRKSFAVRSFLNVTTDKVYENREWPWGYRETDRLNGYDPYSNSKSCSELITHSYCRSFFSDKKTAVSTARAGNVIGGGDFAADRILPDCIRAARKKEPIILRNPCSTRPYQHVLEPLFAYLMIARRQYEEPALAGAYNVGPDDCDCVSTGRLADLFCKIWGEGLTWRSTEEKGPHEANFLKLNCSRLKSTFGWSPRWHIEDAVSYTIAWTKEYLAGQDVGACMDRQIKAFLDKKAGI